MWGERTLTVQYSDGDQDPMLCTINWSRLYSIGRLNTAADYTITVTLENGVSDQDLQ